MLHSQLTIVDNHRPYAFTYADAAAREADTSRTSADVGKLARQLDDNMLWMLVDITPTWIAVSKATVPSTATYTINGVLEVALGTLRKYPDRTITITGVYFSVGVAGGGTVEIDVRKNGTSIFSTKPSIASGQYKSSTQTVSVSVSTTDYLTVDVTQAGSASDAVVTIIYE